MAYWLRYDEYTKEQMSRYDIDELEDDIRWNQQEFSKLIEKLEKQKQQESKNRKKKK